MRLYFLSTHLTVALLALQTTALPRRYFSSLFSDLFSSHGERGRLPAAEVPQNPSPATRFSPSRAQQWPLSPFRDLTAYPRPSPLATAQPYPLSEESNYSRVCNLGYRISSDHEDAAEIADAQCQGGIVRRNIIAAAADAATAADASSSFPFSSSSLSASAKGEEDAGTAKPEEVLECVACEWGTWNGAKGEINR